nr:sigma factor-like helix-turn-helix DNA-binding protein [Streptomyces sp. Root369]
MRTVVVLRYFHDLSDTEIGADLGISLSTVRTRTPPTRPTSTRPRSCAAPGAGGPSASAASPPPSSWRAGNRSGHLGRRRLALGGEQHGHQERCHHPAVRQPRRDHPDGLLTPGPGARQTGAAEDTDEARHRHREGRQELQARFGGRCGPAHPEDRQVRRHGQPDPVSRLIRDATRMTAGPLGSSASRSQPHQEALSSQSVALGPVRR